MWYFILFIVLSLIGFAILLSIKFRNPYKLIMIFGKKGSGKTTYLCKLAQKYLSAGRPVFSDVRIPGVFLISPEDVGFVQFPPESVILLDEVGMIYDNRNFKNFKPEVRDYFKLQRHYRHTVYLFSQTWDIDLKLRNLTDEMYLLINIAGWLSVGKQIKRRIVVVKPSDQAESRIADELVISPFLLTPFGARIYTFIPYWAKFFDSHAAPRLDQKLYQLVDYPDDLPDRFKPKPFRRGKLPFRGILPLSRRRAMTPAEIYIQEQEELLQQFLKESECNDSENEE